MDKQIYEIMQSELHHSASYRRHKNQRFWQILIPMGLGGLLILAAAVMVVLQAAATDAGEPVRQWADVSVVFLSLPVLVFAAFATLVLLTLVFLLARLLKILPGYTMTLQFYAALVSEKVTFYMNKLTAPLVSAKSIQAAVGAFFSSLFGRQRK